MSAHREANLRGLAALVHAREDGDAAFAEQRFEAPHGFLDGVLARQVNKPVLYIHTHIDSRGFIHYNLRGLKLKHALKPIRSPPGKFWFQAAEQLYGAARATDAPRYFIRFSPVSSRVLWSMQAVPRAGPSLPAAAGYVRMKAMPLSRWDAVIFDYGRVLSLTPSDAELQQFAALVGVAEPPFFEIYSDTRHEYDCGRADFRQHWQAFADTAGIELRPAQVERIAEMETLMWLRVNPEALTLAREIKAQGVRIAILSNMPHDLLAYVRREFKWLDEFEVKIWSCEFGTTKPDPAIYRHCLEALGCEPGQTLFFDDRANNVEAARELGMEAHIFECAEQARSIVGGGAALGI